MVATPTTKQQRIIIGGRGCGKSYLLSKEVAKQYGTQQSISPADAPCGVYTPDTNSISEIRQSLPLIDPMENLLEQIESLEYWTKNRTAMERIVNGIIDDAIDDKLRDASYNVEAVSDDASTLEYRIKRMMLELKQLDLSRHRKRENKKRGHHRRGLVRRVWKLDV